MSEILCKVEFLLGNYAYFNLTTLTYRNLAQFGGNSRKGKLASKGLGQSSDWMRLFAYSSKLPAYSGALLLTIDNFSFFTYSWSFFAYSFSFFTYNWSFFAYNGKVHLIRALTDCKQKKLNCKKKSSNCK